MIIYSHSDHTLDYRAWRKGVYDCPHCDFNPKRASIWISKSQIREVLFVSGIYYKKGHAVVLSECPKCFKKSWHHYGLDRLARDKVLDTEKVQAEIDRLTQLATDEWNRSKCKQCIVPKEVKRSKYGNWVSCEYGRTGSPEQPDEEEVYRCKGFKPAEKPTRKTISEDPDNTR